MAGAGLGEYRAQGSLLLEMLDPGQQPRVDAVRAQLGNGKPVANLEEALDWQKVGTGRSTDPWCPGRLRNPRRCWRRTSSGARSCASTGATAASRNGLRRDSVRLPLLAQIRESHCGMLPDDQLPAMLAVQQQRDRRMAERLRDAPRPAMLVAGSFHARRDLGVPVHLRDLGAEKGTQVLMLVEAGQAVTTREADYAWYTPAQPDKDYCAEMKKAR